MRQQLAAAQMQQQLIQQQQQQQQQCGEQQQAVPLVPVPVPPAPTKPPPPVPGHHGQKLTSKVTGSYRQIDLLLLITINQQPIFFLRWNIKTLVFCVFA